MPRRPLNRDEFEIAIICALPVEFNAIDALIEVDWEEETSYRKAQGDPNVYRIGSISDHDVVVAFLPDMGKQSASTAAAWLSTSFRNIKLGLVVGVCGGVPGDGIEDEPILLGDIVISTGIIQFDYGRQFPNEVKRRNTLESNLPRPTSEIRSFLRFLDSRKNKKSIQAKICVYIDEICSQDGFETSRYPGKEEDRLYEGSYRHKHQDTTICQICAKCETDAHPVCEAALESTCAQLGCSEQRTVVRKQGKARARFNQEPFEPYVHFGRIASGDLVMKSGFHRDQIASKEKVIAFEMEGVGVWEAFPTIIIKSVCDYADSHKSKTWQEYAAAAAAACMKAFLKGWRKTDKPSQDSISSEDLMHGPQPKSVDNPTETPIAEGVTKTNESCATTVMRGHPEWHRCDYAPSRNSLPTIPKRHYGIVSLRPWDEERDVGQKRVVWDTFSEDYLCAAIVWFLRQGEHIDPGYKILIPLTRLLDASYWPNRLVFELYIIQDVSEQPPIHPKDVQRRLYCVLQVDFREVRTKYIERKIDSDGKTWNLLHYNLIVKFSQEAAGVRYSTEINGEKVGSVSVHYT